MTPFSPEKFKMDRNVFLSSDKQRNNIFAPTLLSDRSKHRTSRGSEEKKYRNKIQDPIFIEANYKSAIQRNSLNHHDSTKSTSE